MLKSLLSVKERGGFYLERTVIMDVLLEDIQSLKHQMLQARRLDGGQCLSISQKIAGDKLFFSLVVKAAYDMLAKLMV